jgi:hypothetical protein
MIFCNRRWGTFFLFGTKVLFCNRCILTLQGCVGPWYIGDVFDRVHNEALQEARSWKGLGSNRPGDSDQNYRKRGGVSCMNLVWAGGSAGKKPSGKPETVTIKRPFLKFQLPM